MRMMSGGVVAVALMTLIPASADAQRGPRGHRGFASGARSQGVEAIMKLRERLELDEGQVQQLEELRKQAVHRRNTHQAEMEELRSRVRAGDMEAAELRELSRARREASESTREAQRTRIEAILNDTQKEQLQTMRDQARAFERGRQSALRGQRGTQRGVARGGHGMRGRTPRAGMREGRLGTSMRQRAMLNRRMDGRRRGGGLGPPA